MRRTNMGRPRATRRGSEKITIRHTNPFLPSNHSTQTVKAKRRKHASSWGKAFVFLFSSTPSFAIHAMVNSYYAPHVHVSLILGILSLLSLLISSSISHPSVSDFFWPCHNYNFNAIIADGCTTLLSPSLVHAKSRLTMQ